MWYVRQLALFLQFYFTSRPVRSLHSPSLFNLFTKVFTAADDDAFYTDIEQYRTLLADSTHSVSGGDLGAGSRRQNRQRTIAHISRTAVSSPGKCRLLAALVQISGARKVLELGSSVGISTAYLAKGAARGQLSPAVIHSLEGNRELAICARKTLADLGIKHAHIHEGPFETSLEQVLALVQQADFVYIDGNHRYTPTLDYFMSVKPYLAERAIIVIDDIRWSGGMYDAWSEICQDPSITAAIDLFSMGIAYCSTDLMERQHVRLMPNRWPWSVVRG